MLTIQPAKNIHGKLDLPPSSDLFFLATIVSIARRFPVRVSPFPNTPLVKKWQKAFAGHADFSVTDTSITITPITDDPSLRISFLTTNIPWRDISLFALLGMHKTVVFEAIDEKRIQAWSDQARRIGCSLSTTPWESSVCLTLDPAFTLPSQETVVNEYDQDALCGLLLGASLRYIFVSDTVFLSPLRLIAPLFKCSLDVKSAISKERDPLARRIQFMRQKSKPATGQQFIITVDFSPVQELPDAPTPIEISLPGDAVLGATFTAAKCLYPKSSFTIGNIPLETWATPFLPFVRKIGGKVSVQETGRTSFGSVGMLSIQSGELIGKKFECQPSGRFYPYLPALTVIASFSKGESIFRDLADLRNDSPDGIALIESCIRTLGARHGEMPDGIVVQGGSDFDGFDLPTPLPSSCAAAFACAATRCIGSSTIDDTLLKEHYPLFDKYCETLFEYRTSHEKN